MDFEESKTLKWLSETLLEESQDRGEDFDGEDVFPRGHENVKYVDNISLKEMKIDWKEFKNMYQSDGNKLKGCQTGQLWLSGVRQFGPSGRKYAP